MNLIVFVSMSWVKLGDILEGYLGITIKIKKKKKKNSYHAVFYEHQLFHKTDRIQPFTMLLVTPLSSPPFGDIFQ